MASNPPGAPDQPWDRFRIEEELRKLRDHAEAVQRRTSADLIPRAWTDRFAPWVVPALLSLTLAAGGWAIHQHDVAAEIAREYAAQNQAQDLKLAAMEVRLVAMDQAVHAFRSETLAEFNRVRDRLERLEQRR